MKYENLKCFESIIVGLVIVFFNNIEVNIKLHTIILILN
jgi:hypothetical protein